MVPTLSYVFYEDPLCLLILSENNSKQQIDKNSIYELMFGLQLYI